MQPFVYRPDYAGRQTKVTIEIFPDFPFVCGTKGGGHTIVHMSHDEQPDTDVSFDLQALLELAISGIGIVIAATVAVLVVFLQHRRLVRFEVQQSVASLQAVCVDILEQADIIVEIEPLFDAGRFASIHEPVEAARKRAFQCMYEVRPLTGKLRQFASKKVRLNTVTLERSLTLLNSMLDIHDGIIFKHLRNHGRLGLTQKLAGSRTTIIRYMHQVLDDMQKLIESVGGHYVEPSFLEKENPFGPMRQ